MEFSLYSGVDRSYLQNVRPRVVFSSQFENLIHSDFVESKRDLITAALVYSDNNSTEEVDNSVKEEVLSDLYRYRGLGRRETFLSSSTTAEDIDKSTFGKAEDFVNPRDYQTYELVYFDSKAYAEDLEKYRGVGYRNPDGTIVRNFQWVRKEDYEEWDWVFEPGGQAAYNEAVKQEQARIDREYTQAVSNANATFHASLQEEGKTEIAKNGIGQSFDGEMETLVQYTLGRDIFVGDIVQIQNKYGVESTCRVTEAVRTHDINGEYVYPTFENI